MKKKSKIAAVTLSCVFAATMMAGCNKSDTAETTALTATTTATTVAVSEEVTTAAVTTAAVTAETTVSDLITIADYTGLEKSESLYFQDLGSGTAKWRADGGQTDDGCFQITGRTDTWNGAYLTIPDECIGHIVHVSFYAKTTSADTTTVSCTLQVIKPDGSQDWPERINNTAMTPDTWTLIEGDIPVYSDVTGPYIYFESDTVDDFYIDDVNVTCDLTTTADAGYPDLADAAIEAAGTSEIKLDFEDGNAFFTGRGGSADIADGGSGSDHCLAITGRTDTWNGAEADLTAYEIAGKTVKVSFDVCVPEDIAVQCTMQEKDADDNTTYNTVAASDTLKADTWTTVTGTYTVLTTTVDPVIYFEIPDSATDDFMIDNVDIQFAK